MATSTSENVFGVITLGDGRKVAARKTTHTYGEHVTVTYYVSVPIRGAIRERKATPRQAMTFESLPGAGA